MKLKKLIEVEITVDDEYCGNEGFGSGCSGYNDEYRNCYYFNKKLKIDKSDGGVLRCDECKKGEK